jgi:hypothetical protein
MTRKDSWDARLNLRLFHLCHDHYANYQANRLVPWQSSMNLAPVSVPLGCMPVKAEYGRR